MHAAIPAAVLMVWASWDHAGSAVERSAIIEGINIDQVTVYSSLEFSEHA